MVARCGAAAPACVPSFMTISVPPVRGGGGVDAVTVAPKVGGAPPGIRAAGRMGSPGRGPKGGEDPDGEFAQPAQARAPLTAKVAAWRRTSLDPATPWLRRFASRPRIRITRLRKSGPRARQPVFGRVLLLMAFGPVFRHPTP